MTIDRPHLRVAAVARGFVLLALVFPVVWSREDGAILALVAIGGICALATAADFRPGNTGPVLTVLEGLGIGVVCGLSTHSSQALLGALVVAPFVGGVYRGVWGTAQALCGEVAGLIVVLVLADDGLTLDQGYGTFSWACTGLGLGLIGAFLHSALQERTDPLAPYLYAQSLLRQLISISDGLDSGIDPVALGGAILSEVHDELPTSALALYVPRGDTLTPLVTREIDPEALDRCEDVAVEAWAQGRDVLRDRFFAIPLVTDSGITGVVVAAVSDRVDAVVLQVDERLRQLHRTLRERAVHLDTALLFAAFRDSATAEERRRLAREMHDGVAQDIASLGYLVDTLQAAEGDPRQAERIAQVRARITGIVAEIRRSLVNLRTSVGENESLGAAIATFARHLSDASGIPFHVTADERTERLRPEVEAELFRIAQEAMNNAVKHARADTVEVTCQVRAPFARIVVADDGRGLQRGRSDSHGLAIMRERALLVNATLEIGETPGGGLTVSVVLPSADPADPSLDAVGPSDATSHRRSGGHDHGNERVSMTIRVLLVDDHELIRSGLAGVFDVQEDMAVCGQAGSVTEAMAAYSDLRPDVVVADLQLHDGTGLDIVRHVRRASPATGVVVLTMHSGDDQIFAAMEAGASGFVGKDAPSVEVVKAARHAAVSPRSFVCAGLVGAMMRRTGSGESSRLSDREHEVLLLLADGLGAAEIGRRLYLSESTAKSHIARIYQKLGAANRAQALVTAMRVGLLSSIQPPAQGA